MINDLTNETSVAPADRQREAEALVAKGHAALLHGKHAAEAAGTFAQALQIAPDLRDAHLGMAEANFALGQFEVTRAAAAYVQRLAPGTVDAAIAEALTLCLDANYPQAQAVLDDAARRDPGNAYLHALRGYVLRCLGNDYDASLAEAKASRLASSVDLRSIFPQVRRYAAAAPVGAEGDAPRLEPTYSTPPQPMSPGTAMRRRAVQFNFATRGYPIATYAIIGVCVVMFALQSTNDAVTLALFQDNNAVAGGEWYRLFTAMFLHEPRNFIHIFSNMLSLYFIGPFVERVYGTGRYLLLYLGTGLIASLTFFALVPGGVALGASGAIAGIFGVLGAFFFAYRNRLGPAGNAMVQQWIFWLGLNVVFNVLASTSLAWQAHLGGLVAGLILGFVFLPRRIMA